MQSSYWFISGKLNYIAKNTCPVICMAVHQCVNFVLVPVYFLSYKVKEQYGIFYFQKTRMITRLLLPLLLIYSSSRFCTQMMAQRVVIFKIMYYLTLLDVSFLWEASYNSILISLPQRVNTVLHQLLKIKSLIKCVKCCHDFYTCLSYNNYKHSIPFQSTILLSRFMRTIHCVILANPETNFNGPSCFTTFIITLEMALKRFFKLTMNTNTGQTLLPSLLESYSWDGDLNTISSFHALHSILKGSSLRPSQALTTQCTHETKISFMGFKNIFFSCYSLEYYFIFPVKLTVMKGGWRVDFSLGPQHQHPSILIADGQVNVMYCVRTLTLAMVDHFPCVCVPYRGVHPVRTTFLDYLSGVLPSLRYGTDAAAVCSPTKENRKLIA